MNIYVNIKMLYVNKHAIATRLTNENNEIRTRLAEYNEALSAARRLTDQMEKKDLTINTLRNEIHLKDKQIQQI